MRDKHGATFAKRTTAYQTQNRAAARVIMADRERFGGLDAAVVRWAERVVQKVESAAAQPELPGMEP